jgi:ketosteroid isomerase-like protein
VNVHDIMASDQHGIVLATEQLVRDGKSVELRTVHVWRFEEGKPVAWYEYPRDLYQYDAIWSG